MFIVAFFTNFVILRLNVIRGFLNIFKIHMENKNEWVKYFWKSWWSLLIINTDCNPS